MVSFSRYKSEGLMKEEALMLYLLVSCLFMNFPAYPGHLTTFVPRSRIFDYCLSRMGH